MRLSLGWGRRRAGVGCCEGRRCQQSDDEDAISLHDPFLSEFKSGDASSGIARDTMYGVNVRVYKPSRERESHAYGHPAAYAFVKQMKSATFSTGVAVEPSQLAYELPAANAVLKQT